MLPFLHEIQQVLPLNLTLHMDINHVIFPYCVNMKLPVDIEQLLFGDYLFLRIFVYLFLSLLIFERERAQVEEWQREREGDTESEAGSRL